MHVLLDDDLGRLTVRRVSPWHRLLARVLAASLDRQLADGVRPESERDPRRAGHGPDLRRLPPCPGRQPAADAGGVRGPGLTPALADPGPIGRGGNPRRTSRSAGTGSPGRRRN